jgi:DNA polymerase III sliding clamp (beta) subunit (PCNA family)
MEISINNPAKSEIFSLIFQHLKAFTEHIVIMFEKDRVYFQSMDSSRISVFELFIPSTWFDKYVHSKEGTFPVGVSSTLLHKVLNTREKSQETRIVFDSEDDDKMFVYFTSEDKSVFDKHGF